MPLVPFEDRRLHAPKPNGTCTCNGRSIYNADHLVKVTRNGFGAYRGTPSVDRSSVIPANVYANARRLQSQ